MKSHISKSIGWLSAVAAIFCLSLQTPVSAQSNCDLTFAPYPGYLTSYITAYPNYNSSKGSQQQLISWALVLVTNTVNHTNYSNPPIPYGEYPAFCVDEQDFINAAYTIPGTLYSGELYSTCDPNLNSELPPGHPNTLVSPATWDLVNYILNYHMYNGSNAFYWDVQAAINTLVGSDVGSSNPCGGLYTTPTPSGGCEGYPVYDPVVVNALLTAASNNAPSWVPQCGNVLGAIYVTSPTSDQFLIVEVPVPCAPCISVSKQVACLQPTNNCSEFGKVAEGFAGAGCSGINRPAFCYQIVITNCGTIPLTNISVSDSLLGNLTASFVTNQNEVLEPGACITNVFSMSFASTATNMVTVTGDASLSSRVTNGSEVYSNGTPVSASDSAVAHVDTAAVSCNLTLYSPLDLDGNPYDNNVTLPAASYYSTNPLITLSISVTNTGSSALSDVTISSPGLTGFNCSMPAPFNLPVGGSTNIQLCLGYVTCPAQMNFNLNVNADVVPDANHCAVYDLTSTNLISVCSSCSGSISCSPNYGCTGGTADLTGSVLLQCSTGVTNTNGDSGLAGLTVTLYGGTNNVLGTTTTDVNGNYAFTNLASGIYYVQVTIPSNYVETLPIGVTNGEVEVTIVPCTNADVVFGLANTTPPMIIVPPGGSLGCNPTNLPTTASMSSNISVSVSCGSATTNITSMDTTNGCLYARTFTIIVTDTYGNSATNYVTNTWTEATLVFITVPPGGPLGCNPTNIPADTDISNAMVLADTCSTVTNSVSHQDSSNGCNYTRIFTLSAVDACGDTAVAYVTNTWTEATLVFTTVPPGGPLGCNPTNIPADTDISNAMVLADTCSTVTNSVSHQDSSNGCNYTRIFTLSAVDACGDTAVAYVTNTWTEATLAFVSVPTGAALGCNPTNIPTDSSISNAVTLADTCSTVTNSVSHQDSTNGCVITRIFTISAVDACGDTAMAYVTNSWTADTAPPVFNNLPTNQNFGCNPANIPTAASVQALVTASDTCSPATVNVTCATTTNGCAWTQIFTIIATNACGNMATAYVTNTWTVDTTAPTLIVPAGQSLGCNPTNVPTVSSISNLVKAIDSCSTPTVNVTCGTTTNDCAVTQIFTVTATDACGNVAMGYVTNTWTANTTAPTLSGVPASQNLGCNPTNLATVASIKSAVSASDSCSTAVINVTEATSTNGCAWTAIFTITATDSCSNSAVAYVTNTWTADSTPPTLSGVPTGKNLGCNPTNIPTAASVQASVSANDTCSPATIHVTCVTATNACTATQIFTIIATNACGNKATACVTNTWTANPAPPVLSGIPTGKSLGCNPTNIPTAASVQSSVTASDTCSPATVTVTGAITTNGCGATQIFTILATNGCGNMATAYVTNTWSVIPTVLVTNTSYATNTTIVTNISYVTNVTVATNMSLVTNVTVSTNCCTNSICGNFNSQNPGNSSWLWLNAHINCNPGSNCTLNCQGGSVTLACTDGKSYSFPVPNGQVCFSSTCTVATNWFDGTSWHTTLPCSGDSQIFLQGCAIPWQADFANCQSVCWTAAFSCATPGLNCNWQWGAACYNGSAPGCGSIAPKACQQTYCPNGQYYNSGDQAGCPENYKPYCVGGGTGGGAANCTGSWSGTSTTCTFGLKTNVTVTTVTTLTTNTTVTTNKTTVPVSTITTNTTVTTATAGPILSGVPSGMNFGCNPKTVPTVASVQAGISASETCSAAAVQVTGVNTTNGCAVTQVFTIIASNACGNSTTAYVTNTWTADTTPPALNGVPAGGYLGCNSASLPTASNVLAEVSASDACSAATVTVTNVDSTNGCTATRVFTITATDSCGNTVTTNMTYTWTIRTPDYCTNSITCGFNSQNPGSGWLWLNAHCSGNPGSNCTLYCQNASIKLSCNNGKSYTYPVPNGIINFSSSCTVGTNWFDGTNWNTTLPCAGDDEIFLQGCGIPWQSAFASCQSVCWTGVFSCTTPGQAFNWQFGAACYANSQPAYTNICPKACHQIACPNGLYYNSSDHAGCPENQKPYCVAGGTGGGGANCTGSWSGTDTTCTFLPGTVLAPVLNGIPACDNLGINPTNIPTISNILAEVTASDTCSPPIISVTMADTTNGCSVTQIFTITATNVCGAVTTCYVTNTWTTMACTNRCTNTICSSFNSQNPGSNCWVWFNSQLTGKPGTNTVYVVCSNASVTLSCTDGKSYTFPVPNGQVLFSSACTNGTNWFDGTNWNTTLPCGGDDQIFVQGCAIPWQSDFANCKSVCWSGVYCCNVPGLNFNWQFGAACYSGQQPGYNNLCPKACHQTPCQNGQYYNSSHNAGTPENWNPYCVGGGTGSGGSNWTGNFSNPGTCSF